MAGWSPIWPNNACFLCMVCYARRPEDQSCLEIPVFVKNLHFLVHWIFYIVIMCKIDHCNISNNIQICCPALWSCIIKRSGSEIDLRSRCSSIRRRHFMLLGMQTSHQFQLYRLLGNFMSLWTAITSAGLLESLKIFTGSFTTMIVYISTKVALIIHNLLAMNLINCR